MSGHGSVARHATLRRDALRSPSTATSISSRSRSASCALERRRRVRREPAAPRGRARSGSSTRARRPRTAGPASTTCGPASFKDLYPALPHDARPLRGPEGRLGLPRPARRARGREGARLLRQAADRGVRHRGVQPPLPRVGAPLRRGLVGAHRAASGCGSTPPTRTGRSPTTTSRASGGYFKHDVGPRPVYEGFKVVPYCGRCGTALSSHEVAQGYEDVTEPSVYVRFPVVGPRLRPPRLDDHAVDADLQRRRSRSAPTSSTCASAAERRRPRPRPRRGTRRGRARRRRRGRRSGRRSPSSSGLRYERPFDARRRSTTARAPRVVAADFVTIDDGSGIVHLAPAFGEIDREVGEREGSPCSTRSTRRRASTASVPPYAGRFVKDADPAIIDDARRGRPPRARRRLHPLVPALLALRHPAHLLGEADVVRARRPTRRDDAPAARTRRSAGTRSTSSTAASATGSRTTSTGRSRATASGARRSRSGGAATAAHDTCVGSVAELAELSRAATSPTSTSTARTSTTSTFACPECGGRAAPRRARARRLVRLGLDAGRAAPLPVRARRPVRAPVPRRLHLRGDRPDARLVLLAARGEHARVRPDAVPQRRVPRAHRRPRRPEDVEVARQRHRPVDDPRAPRRRRAALVLLLGRFAVDQPPRRTTEGDRRVDPALPPDALEHLLVLRHLRDPRRLGARRGAVAGRTATTSSTAGSGRGCTRRSATVTDALEASTRCAARRRSSPSSTTSRTGTCAARARGSGRRPTPRAHATLHECLRTIATAARAVLPVRRRRAVRATSARTRRSRCTSPTGPTPTRPRSTRRSRPRSPPRGRSSRSAAPPATRRSSRSASRCRARSSCSPTAQALTPALVAEVADELNVKQVEPSPTSRASSTTRSCRTSARSGRRSAS